MKKNRYALMSAMLGVTLMALSSGEGRIHNASPERVSNPWDRIDLTKAERKGKTYEEIQAMRRAKWEATRGQA